MKKVSIIFAALAMIFAVSFMACRNGGTEATQEDTEEAAPTEEATPAEETAPEGQLVPSEGTDAATDAEATDAEKEEQ
jgi:hypothetical protein